MASNLMAAAVNSHEVVFAGDAVHLAGQIDVPEGGQKRQTYPLIFIIHHAAAPSREDYAPFSNMALEARYAMFRWDRRGSGRSGGGARGSTIQDAVNAYEIALEQKAVRRQNVVILAFGAGTALLGNSFGLFARVQRPAGVLLISNQLNARQILAIDTRVLLVSGAGDWNATPEYTAMPALAHRKTYSYGADAFVAPDADSMLLMDDGNMHPRARKEMTTWLLNLQRNSTSI
ncbi:MAG: hypothetical protein IAE89_16755 [Anaerolineae bacterium]|nr:hypothetical protein [Anaerolineae bacterium]